MRALLIVIALSLNVCAGDETRDCKSPKGWWTLRVPGRWVVGDAPDPNFQESVTLRDPSAQGFFYRVQVAEDGLSLDAEAKRFREGYSQRDMKVESLSELVLGGCKAARFDLVFEGGGGTTRVRMAIVDGGKRKAILWAALPEPSPAAKWEEIDRATLTFNLARLDPTTVDWKARKFNALPLELDLPVDGVLKEHPLAVEIAWDGLGVEFGADCQRTNGKLDDLLQDRMLATLGSSRQKLNELVSKEEISVGAAKALRARVRRGRADGTFVESSVLFVRVGEGETWMLVASKVGDEPGVALDRFDAAFAKARILHAALAPPAASLPPLTNRAQCWAGAAELGVPEGWKQSPQYEINCGEDGPHVEGTSRWGAEGAADLGVVAMNGTIRGGREAFLKWMRGGDNDRPDAGKTSEAIATDIGGRKGSLWEMETEHDWNRWITKNIVVFDGERFFWLQQRFPREVAKVYGPLLDQVAATVTWKK